MSEFNAVIDFGSNNLRIGVFDSQSKIIYSSKVSMRDSLYNEKSNNYLNEFPNAFDNRSQFRILYYTDYI